LGFKYVLGGLSHPLCKLTARWFVGEFQIFEGGMYMSYLGNCEYVETFEPEHVYTFNGNCVLSNEPVEITVKAKDLYAFNQGMYVQKAFPYLTADEREFVLTGMYSL
jgi:hypothetical protein